MSLFEAMFGPPPTPEERVEHQKRVLGTCESVLPLVAEARRKLHEVGSLIDCEDRDLAKARRYLAAYEDRLLAAVARLRGGAGA